MRCIILKKDVIIGIGIGIQVGHCDCAALMTDIGRTKTY